MTAASRSRPDEPATLDSPEAGAGGPHNEGDFGDLLQELRILLQGVQVLTGFLIVLPFNARFSEVQGAERIVYVVSFLCALLSLALLSAPAAQHRMMTPLQDRPAFKRKSTRLIIAGTMLLSVALVLVAHFVIDTVVGGTIATIVAAAVATVIAVLWWIVPFARRHVS